MKPPLAVREVCGLVYGIVDADGEEVMDLGCCDTACCCSGSAAPGLLEVLVAAFNLVAGGGDV